MKRVEKSTRELVLEAICDLHEREQIATRETIFQLLSVNHEKITQTIVDDRLSTLADDGEIHRIQRGVYVPAITHKPARIISKTMIPGGIVKLEVGDDHVLTLTPREARMIGLLMAGDAQEYAAVEMGHQTAILNSELAAEVRDLRRKVKSLTEPG